MRQIVGFPGRVGNSQNAPVRSYVLYFERLAGRAEEGQGAWVGPVRGNGVKGGQERCRELRQELSRREKSFGTEGKEMGAVTSW